ncbi:MAG: hypothetical protein ABI594_04370 [Ginsengibacter sp.]
MTGIFRANNPFNTFILFVYGLFLKLAWFISPQIPVVQKTDGFLFNRILIWAKPTFDSFPVIYSIIMYLLLYTQAISFNQLLNNRKLMQKPNYLPGMSYLLITSFFIEWNVLSAPMIINTLIIWVWAKLSTLYNNQHIKSTLFDIGLAIGISTFFYFPSFAFALLIIFGLVLTRPPRIAEWLIPLLGILTPWYFLFAWLFLADTLYSFQVPGIEIKQPLFAKDNTEYAGIVLILAAAMVGAFFVQLYARRQIVQVRKSWGLLSLYLAVALFVPFINNSHSLEYWLLATVPLSAFIACTFFYTKKNWVAALLHWAMVAFAIYITYFKS